MRSGSPSCSPTRRTSSLNKRSQRLDELHAHVGREPADVVMRLDLRGDADVAAGLDHVRVERALDQEPHVARGVFPTGVRAATRQPAGLLLEDADELLTDDRALSSGSLTPSSRLRKRSRASTWTRDVEVVAERLHDLLGLVLAQQAVVDEDAGQLVAHRLARGARRRPSRRRRARR